MRYEIKFKLPFNKTQLKKLGLDNSEESNGCYWYDKDLIVINIASGEFEGLPEEEIVSLFGKVDMHERLHHEIYNIVGDVYNNNVEERFVCLMTEQETW